MSFWPSMKWLKKYSGGIAISSNNPILRRSNLILAGLLPLFLFLPLRISSETGSEWGFYAHRLINKMAVYTLPPEMMGLYKDQIEWISEHAVDPDKRRYATKYEAIRHYIDIDVWGSYPFPELPRDWVGAIAGFAQLYWIAPEGDTVKLIDQKYPSTSNTWIVHGEEGVDSLEAEQYLNLFRREILPGYYDEHWTIPSNIFSDLIEADWTDSGYIWVQDTFSQHGVLPWHVQQMYRRLVRAFREQDTDAVLRLSADFGHYLADAHVPLHTTKNYNGQLTNQLGIHAFWETRIPELFAESTYDFFVGKADYIRDEQSYFWDMVLESHRLVDSVLGIERRLSKEIPEEKQYCYEERLNRTIRTQCKDYANAYRTAMSGMVEQRMRQAIHAIGSTWYSAWVDAGQPPLTRRDLEWSYEYREDTLPSGPKNWKPRKHEQ